MIAPLPRPSYGNSRYVLMFIDDFSSYCWVFFVKLKSEVFQTFKFFKASVEKFNGKKIKGLRSYNWKEYVNMDLKYLCEEDGIQIQHSLPYTPQQNGVIEFKNRALKEMATYMLEGMYLSPKLWDQHLTPPKMCLCQMPMKSVGYGMRGFGT